MSDLSPDAPTGRQSAGEQAGEAGADSDRFGAPDRELDRVITEAAGNRLFGAFMAWTVDVLAPSLQERLKPAVV